MVIADYHSNLRQPDVLILLMVNDCNGLDLLAYRWSGRSLRQLL